MLKIFGQTRKHEGDGDKPNEDVFGFNRWGFVALGDGVTRSRATDGTYPVHVAKVAPNTFLAAMLAEYCEFQGGVLEMFLRNAFKKANETITIASEEQGVTSHTVDYGVTDYLGTTGVCLLVHEGRAALAYIGDPIALYLPKGGTPRLLTTDQLKPCHRFGKPHFSAMVSSTVSQKEVNNRRTFWQRSQVRNNPAAIDPSGNLIGFGVLTGEPSALEFLQIVELQVQPGDRFILSSDALRAAGCFDNDDEGVHSYAPALEAISSIPFEGWPSALIDLIRHCEVRDKVRSDDATVVVAEVI
ncbi:MAG: hypothetical protein JWP09_240 [Candidatus Taylorbacteria bacterium]|nr:hypothetical protein [Candidatus Taylorbacteria bacterium]